MSVKGKVVLCIDDEEPALVLRKMLLESLGFVVLTATSGKMGLQIFANQHVDAAVVDFAMPEMDGTLVAAEIKRQNPRIPIIMLTAYASVSASVTGIVDCFIVKGEDPTVVISKLESLIRIRGHRHPELEHKYVVFADNSRHYLDCSDAVTELLGYTRMEFLEMSIDKISDQPDRVQTLFKELQSQGFLEGAHILRHKNGSPVPIRYQSYAFPDGCLAATWDPVEGWQQIFQAAIGRGPDHLSDIAPTARAAIELRMKELLERHHQNQHG